MFFLQIDNGGGYRMFLQTVGVGCPFDFTPDTSNAKTFRTLADADETGQSIANTLAGWEVYVMDNKGNRVQRCYGQAKKG